MVLGTHAPSLGLAGLLLVSPPSVEGPAPAPPVETAQAAAAPRRPSKRNKQLLTLGSIATTLGGAALLTGVVLVTRPEIQLESDPMLARSYKPAGVTTAVVGAAVLATGVVMLIAALQGKRKRARS